eukprot:gene5241-132_t
MLGHCGIDYWEPNSRVVRAVSQTPEGPYEFKEVVMENWAHEPNAVRAPTGEWVVYASYRHPNDVPLSNCNKTTGARTGLRAAAARGGRWQAGAGYSPRNTYMTWSKNPDGPWSEPELVLSANTSIWDNNTVLIDTNLAVVIRKDGSAVGIWRKCENTPHTVCQDECCTFPHLLTAPDWRNASSYYPHSDAQLFPELAPYGAEDPFLWVGSRGGAIHAILHDEQ